jgi:hypothetical protein
MDLLKTLREAMERQFGRWYAEIPGALQEMPASGAPLVTLPATEEAAPTTREQARQVPFERQGFLGGNPCTRTFGV